MNLKNLVNRLHTVALGEKNKTLFLQMMPGGVERAILLRSPLQGTKIDHYLPGYYKGEFQVIVRSRDYEDGAVLIKRVVETLTLENEELGSQLFNYCRPQHLPVAFPLSDGNLVEHTVMFDACYVEQ